MFGATGVNGMKLPSTVKQLNNWIDAHFCVYTGNRSYFEFGFPMCIGFDGEQDYARTSHRAPYISLAYIGFEEDCCKRIAMLLESLVTREQFLDCCEPLFIRQEFVLVKEEKARVVGRLAFWDTTKNKKLMQTDCYVPQGGVAREARPLSE